MSSGVNARMDRLTQQMDDISRATERGDPTRAGQSIGVTSRQIPRRKRARSDLGGVEGARVGEAPGRARLVDENLAQPSQPKRRRTIPLAAARPHAHFSSSNANIVRHGGTSLSIGSTGSTWSTSRSVDVNESAGASIEAFPVPHWLQHDAVSPEPGRPPSPVPAWLIPHLLRATAPKATLRSHVAPPSSGSIVERPSLSSPTPTMLSLHVPSSVERRRFRPSTLDEDRPSTPLPFSTSGRNEIVPSLERFGSVSDWNEPSLYERQLERDVHLARQPALSTLPDLPASVGHASPLVSGPTTHPVFDNFEMTQSETVQALEAAARNHSPSAFSMRKPQTSSDPPASFELGSDPTSSTSDVLSPSTRFWPTAATTSLTSIPQATVSSPPLLDLSPSSPPVLSGRQAQANLAPPNRGFWFRPPKPPSIDRPPRQKDSRGRERYQRYLEEAAASLFDRSSSPSEGVQPNRRFESPKSNEPSTTAMEPSSNPRSNALLDRASPSLALSSHTRPSKDEPLVSILSDSTTSLSAAVRGLSSPRSLDHHDENDENAPPCLGRVDPKPLKLARAPPTPPLVTPTRMDRLAGTAGEPRSIPPFPEPEPLGRSIHERPSTDPRATPIMDKLFEPRDLEGEDDGEGQPRPLSVANLEAHSRGSTFPHSGAGSQAVSFSTGAHALNEHDDPPLRCRGNTTGSDGGAPFAKGNPIERVAVMREALAREIEDPGNE